MEKEGYARDASTFASRLTTHALYAVPLGLLLTGLGLTDVFFTILHADRQGPVSRWTDRIIWRAMRGASGSRRPWLRRESLALAGPLMMTTTVLVWVVLLVTGFALLYWPFLATGFDAHPPDPTASFGHAFYVSGVTFTTLGYGDVTPAFTVFKVLTVVESLSGFGVMTASITYLLAIVSGLEQREAMALRVLAETGWTGRGARLVGRVLRDEGPDGLRERPEAWADLLRHMQEKTHRFPILVFHYRTRNRMKDPEPMLRALAATAVAARLAASAEPARRARPAAEHLDVALRQAMEAIVSHHARRDARRALAHPRPDAHERRLLDEARAEVERETGLSIPAPDAALERELLRTLHRTRVLLDELDRLTGRRAIHEEPPGPPESPADPSTG